MLASLTSGSKIVCDIGCDHAYTLVQALLNYGVERGIAADINPLPLANASKNITVNKLNERIKCVLSDGFAEITDYFDTAILSGMGGILICDILKRGLAKIKNKKLIISANNDTPLVRSFMLQNDFFLKDEFAVEENNKYYEILVYESGFDSLDAYDILYGKCLRRKKETAFIKHYTKKKALLEKIIKDIADDELKEEKKKLLTEVNYLLEGKNMEKHFIDNTPNYYRCYFIDDTTRPTIIVSPGGGYKYTSPRESEPVVEVFNKRGYHVIVVNYREELLPYPKPQEFLAKAIDEVAKDKRIGKLIGLGFSAGGHCLLEVILHAADHNLKTKFDLLMLGYPVITTDERYWHQGSYVNLLQDKINDQKLLKYLSLETQVTNSAPDLFLWGTFTDESVSVMNSLMLLEAYYQAKANVEYHTFYFGGHALSVANAASSEGNKAKESPYIARWIDLACEWLKRKLA